MDDKNRDRGTIKWTSMMLPEHVGQLRDFFEYKYNAEKQPIMDEQMMEMIFLTIQEACEFQQEIELKIFKENRISSITGMVKMIEYQKRYILIEENADEVKVSFDHVVGVNHA
ncbi:YolD-like family protein [Jeotgalibacillus haloalkalitolerans]|uniref:YolD-like family protein n=1 Tax=Jeotgalibacillus haloalkalitolerans TaxID=3104292 RepID=A0ABU5KMQ7_9BACL|nr:YolD-like family protein [Jeotgalibacillus sp. HH7-29]MDZ5712226.1 YolD-like family protein [Jeotgalibacillus sp. HH7-29]